MVESPPKFCCLLWEFVPEAIKQLAVGRLHGKGESNQKYLAFPSHAVKSRSLAKLLPGTEWGRDASLLMRGHLEICCPRILYQDHSLTQSLLPKAKVALREVKKNCCLPLCLPCGSPPCKQRLETPQSLNRLLRFFLYLSECDSLYRFELPHNKEHPLTRSSGLSALTNWLSL